MKRTTTIEGIILLLISLLGIREGFHLNAVKDIRTLSSLLGPGTYILLISFGLLVTAAAHVIFNATKVHPLNKASLIGKNDLPASKKLIGMIGVFAGYAYCIDIFGYILPTIFFFLLEFRLAGVKSWRINILLTAGLVASFQIVFIKYCEMIFPRGIFWN